MNRLLFRARETRRRLKRWMNQVRGRDLRFERQVRVPTLRLGSEYGGWTVCPVGLSSASVVYSFGIGRDITWDLAMIDRFGMEVHAFDPTPISVSWIRGQRLDPRFVHHPIGLAAFDGTARFAPISANPGWDSYVLDGRSAAAERDVEVPVMRLESITRMLGHDRIDLLKMDIEHSEYPVLRDLAAGAIRPRQLLVEMHYTPGVTEDLARLREGVETVLGMGYHIFCRAGMGLEFSFIRD